MSNQNGVTLRKPEREFVMVYQDFLRNTLLSAEEKMLFIALKSFVTYGEDGGKVFPSNEILQKITGMSKPRVIRNLQSLQEKNIIKIKRRGLTKTNMYTIADYAIMWQSKTEEELKTNSEAMIDATDRELIEELRRRGYNVEETKKTAPEPTEQIQTVVQGVVSETEKEPVSAHLQAQNNTNSKAINQSNNKPEPAQSQEKIQHCTTELYTKEDLQEILELDYANIAPEDKEAILAVIHTAVNSSKEYLRVNSTSIHRDRVTAKLLKLSPLELEFVMEQYHKQQTNIVNPSGYLLTQLFRAKEQYHLYLMNLGHQNGDF